MFRWKDFTPDAFEKLCAELLEHSGFTNLEWFGSGGGDKGRDLVGNRIHEPLPGTRRMQRWVVQCKRYTEKRLTKVEIEAFLVACKEHRPDCVLLIVTSTLSADVRDWLNATKVDYRFDVLVWEERDLEREIRRFRERLTNVPEIEPKSERPVLFYPMSSGDQNYMCNEVEEVGFHVMNADGTENDIERVKEFIDFIRHNEISFDAPEDDENGDDAG